MRPCKTNRYFQHGDIYFKIYGSLFDKYRYRNFYKDTCILKRDSICYSISPQGTWYYVAISCGEIKFLTMIFYYYLKWLTIHLRIFLYDFIVINSLEQIVEDMLVFFRNRFIFTLTSNVSITLFWDRTCSKY